MKLCKIRQIFSPLFLESVNTMETTGAKNSGETAKLVEPDQTSRQNKLTKGDCYPSGTRINVGQECATQGLKHGTHLRLKQQKIDTLRPKPEKKTVQK